MGTREVVKEGTQERYVLERYVWRGEPIKSPLTGQTMHGIVGVDSNGTYRAGVRFGKIVEGKAADDARAFGAELHESFVFYDKPHATLKNALETVRQELRSNLTDHARLAVEIRGIEGPTSVLVEAESVRRANGERKAAAAEKYGAKASHRSEERGRS